MFPYKKGRSSLPVECHRGFSSYLSLQIANLTKSELNVIDRLKMREWDKIRYSVKLLHCWWE